MLNIKQIVSILQSSPFIDKVNVYNQTENSASFDFYSTDMQYFSLDISEAMDGFTYSLFDDESEIASGKLANIEGIDEAIESVSNTLKSDDDSMLDDIGDETYVNEEDVYDYEDMGDTRELKFSGSKLAKYVGKIWQGVDIVKVGSPIMDGDNFLGYEIYPKIGESFTKEAYDADANELIPIVSAEDDEEEGCKCKDKKKNVGISKEEKLFKTSTRPDAIDEDGTPLSIVDMRTQKDPKAIAQMILDMLLEDVPLEYLKENIDDTVDNIDVNLQLLGYKEDEIGALYGPVQDAFMGLLGIPTYQEAFDSNRYRDPNNEEFPVRDDIVDEDDYQD
ncbi:MAG: hypothetical protein WC783_00095 [Candidatus Paceibacterota bacterium]|jgi:hypothetical protein